MSSEKRANDAGNEQEAQIEQSSTREVDTEAIALENYSLPAYLTDDDDPFADSADDIHRQTDFYTPRPALSRGFSAPAPFDVPPVAPSRHSATSGTEAAIALPSDRPNSKDTKRSWLFWRKANRTKNALAQPNASPTAYLPGPQTPASGIAPSISPQTGEAIGQSAPAAPPKLWEKQPYQAILCISAIAGTLAAAWLLGILAARILPGSVTRLPLQESILRKSNRMASELWQLPQSWKTPPTQTRIEAIPLPEVGLVIEDIELSPIERQPLIDELNTVETELLTLDRRIQALEKQLGKPPYQGADIESRIKGLRSAIDPPVRTAANPQYTPAPSDPQAALLTVTEHQITLPSDALFAPGDSTLKDSELLQQTLDRLVNYPHATVIVRSYSDNQGDAIAARKYTLAQANELSRYLASALPEGYRWVAIGGGHTQPIVPNDSAPNRQRNRRIEILVDTR